MFDPLQAKETFRNISHIQKLKKVQEILKLLSKKSPFFADLWNHFKYQKDIQENALDAMYNIVMNLVYNNQKQ